MDNIFDRANNKVDIRSLVGQILPIGKFAGYEYVAINPTRNDSSLGSFRINTRTGKWADFASGDKGTGSVSLYAYVKGLEHLEAAKELLGNYDYGYSNHKSQVNLKKNDTASYIKKVIKECYGYRSTPVEKYLNNRGITCEIPNNNILYHPKLYHAKTNKEYPAMVAEVTRWPDKKVVGLHRTYLTHDGKKANITPNKMMIGNILGGAVVIGSPDAKLVVAEGIETALSVYMSTEFPVFAALSASNMEAVIVPDISITNHVMIAVDNDEPGMKSAKTLARRLYHEGYKVDLAVPPYGMDFNDVLLLKE